MCLLSVQHMACNIMQHNLKQAFMNKHASSIESILQNRLLLNILDNLEWRGD